MLGPGYAGAQPWMGWRRPVTACWRLCMIPSSTIFCLYACGTWRLCLLYVMSSCLVTGAYGVAFIPITCPSCCGGWSPRRFLPSFFWRCHVSCPTFHYCLLPIYLLPSIAFCIPCVTCIFFYMYDASSCSLPTYDSSLLCTFGVKPLFFITIY